jgi:hypothetical protein
MMKKSFARFIRIPVILATAVLTLLLGIQPVLAADPVIQGTSPTSITVLTPNGGESLTAGSSYLITWTSVNPGGHVKIQLLKTGLVIKTITDDANTSAGSFNWHLSSTLVPDVDYTIKITSTSNALVTDVSDGNFTIVGPPPASVTVTLPNGGESLTAGSSYLITWTSVNPSGHVKIQLLKSAVVIKTITSYANTSAGSFNWHILSTLVPDVDYTIKITSTSNALVTDVSDGNFTIVGPPPPSVALTSPVGGEIWNAGDAHLITWTSVNPGGHVKIQLLKTDVVIATITSCANTSAGSFNWHLSSTLASGLDYSIKITSTSNPAVTDTSAYFEIVALPPPSVTVLTPNGGESLTAGSSYLITWTSVNPSGHVKIQLLKSAVVIKTITSYANTSAGSFNWHIPSTLVPDVDYTIKIISTCNALVTDVSDGNFTILGPP